MAPIPHLHRLHTRRFPGQRLPNFRPPLWSPNPLSSGSILGFGVICITLLACSSPNYQSGSFVYRDFFNETGWPDGLAWLLGLLQGGLGLTGFDAVAHMIEEIPAPTIEGPRIMIACVGIGLFTGFVFLSVLLIRAQGRRRRNRVHSRSRAADILRRDRQQSWSDLSAHVPINMPALCDNKAS